MVQQDTRNRIGVGFLAASFAFLVGAIIYAQFSEEKPRADPGDAAQVARGKPVYARHCAACHGAGLQGQPDWREKLPTGRMPAPPHDASGHTWHHPDAVLFGITRQGLVPGRYAPPNYQSDMPAFGGTLSDDEIWAVLAFIKSSWPEKIRRAQADITRDSLRR
ncbi:MAG: c-type cytochrome [Betaproteobacteria bacterium]|nr:c-type cytochrome [Betaproteobacteria bacterium]